MLRGKVRLQSDAPIISMRGYWLLLVFPLAHAAAITLFAGIAKPLSFIFLIVAPVLAAVACLHRASGDRMGWNSVAGAMLLWASGMAVVMHGSLSVPEPGNGPALGLLLYVLYGVPLIFTLASPRDDPWHVRLVDGALALALGVLFYIHTYTFAALGVGGSEEGLEKLRLMFDVQNSFIALLSLVRYAASPPGRRRSFFAVLTLFAFAYLATAGFINHFQYETDYGTLPEIVIPLPFLLLAVAALAGRPAEASAEHAPRADLIRLVRAGSPLMLPCTLLIVSGLLVAHRPGLAIGGFIFALLGYGLRNVLLQMRGFEERDRLDALTRTDALTGLPNRRHFDAVLQREWNRARRAGTSLAVLMIDIDYFKQLNDGLGHAVGDQRLREVAAILGGCTARAGDLVARYGGEEFVAILPATGPAAAAMMAEKLRAEVAAARLPSPCQGGHVTISLGIGWLNRIDGQDPADLLTAADTALYEAKRAGRDCVRQNSPERTRPTLRAVS